MRYRFNRDILVWGARERGSGTASSNVDRLKSSLNRLDRGSVGPGWLISSLLVETGRQLNDHTGFPGLLFERIEKMSETREKMINGILVSLSLSLSLGGHGKHRAWLNATFTWWAVIDQGGGEHGIG